jgi:hypothetical protein
MNQSRFGAVFFGFIASRPASLVTLKAWHEPQAQPYHHATSPNLALKPQPNSHYRQANAHIAGKLYRKSMGTDDIKLAQSKAWQWYHPLVTAPIDDDRRLVADWAELARTHDQSLSSEAKRSCQIEQIHIAAQLGGWSERICYFIDNHHFV